MKTFTLIFCYVSNATRNTVPLLDERGNEITLQVESTAKSATYSHPDVIKFCQEQGNDCRIRLVT